MTSTQDNAPDLCVPEHFEQFRGEVARELEKALKYYTSTGTGPGPEKWRGDDARALSLRLMSAALDAALREVMAR